jgi:putative membrane protein
MMMGFGFVWILIIIGIIAFLLGWRPDFSSDHQIGRQDQGTPLEIIKERYARGEISQEEYQKMRTDLES